VRNHNKSSLNGLYKKLISAIMYSNKAAKINEYEKFVKWSKTKNMMENAV